MFSGGLGGGVNVRLVAGGYLGPGLLLARREGRVEEGADTVDPRCDVKHHPPLIRRLKKLQLVKSGPKRHFRISGKIKGVMGGMLQISPPLTSSTPNCHLSEQEATPQDYPAVCFLVWALHRSSKFSFCEGIA